MAVPWLSCIATAARWFWRKMRGRPTVQADRGALAAGRDQTITDSIIATGQAVRGEMAGFLATTQHFYGPVYIMHAPRYLNDLARASSGGLSEAFEEAQRLKAAGDPAGAIRQYEKLFAVVDQDIDRCALHVTIGHNFGLLGRHTEAEGHFLQALDLARRRGEPEAEALALAGLGVTYYARQNWDTAETYHKQALAIFQSLRHEACVAQALHSLGLVHVKQGRLDEAERSFLAASDLFGTEGDLLQQAQSLNSAGTISADRGDRAEALKRYGRAYDLFNRMGDERGKARTQGNLATIHLERDEFAEAERRADQALELFRQMADLRGQAFMALVLGLALFQRVDLARAEDNLRRAQELFSQAGDGSRAAQLHGIIESLQKLQRLRGAGPPKPKRKRTHKKPPPKPC